MSLISDMNKDFYELYNRNLEAKKAYCTQQIEKKVDVNKEVKKDVKKVTKK